MSKSDLPDFPSFRKQHLLIEYFGLKDQCPPGIYISVNPNDYSLWSGVFFVRKGPYASAILRFSIAFSPRYPDVPPAVTFATDIFHPLIIPSTTFSISNHLSMDQNLSMGGFCLQNAFPGWFDGDEEIKQSASIVAVLRYIKSAFEDPKVLDSLPLEAAGNSGAWHAWRSHRGLPKSLGSAATTADGIGARETADGIQSQPGDWNWEGVWRNRVEAGIENSLSEPVLYGPKTTKPDVQTDMIRFSKLGVGQLNEIRPIITSSVE